MTGKFRDLGPAPIDEPEKGLELHEPPPPKETVKKRIGPKLGLEGMTFFLMEIVSRGTMRDGSLATEQITMLKAVDLETLTDIADTLDYFRIQRMHARLEAERKGRR